MSALIWPTNKPSYFVYKPLNSSSKSIKSGYSSRFLNSLQLLYYKYLLHTGLYMLSWREQTTINAIVVICFILSVYWFFKG